MDYRIYASDVHGREKGQIKTVNGNTVINVDRKESSWQGIDEELLKATAASESGIKCVLLPIPDGCTGKRYGAVVAGIDKCDHPDTITSGITCHKISYTKAAIEIPVENIDGISDLCFKLIAVPAVVPFYNEEGVDELVLLIMPQGAFIFSDVTCELADHQFTWDQFVYPGPVTDKDVNAGSPASLTLHDDFGDEEELRNKAWNMYNRYYGYPDVMLEDVTITYKGDDAYEATLPDDMVMKFADKCVSDIHAWIRGVHELKLALENPDNAEYVAAAQETLSYRCVEYVEQGPTEEEMHPPQPETPAEGEVIDVPTEETQTEAQPEVTQG